MLRITLTAPEQAALEHLFKTTSNRRLRDRCQAVLMASRGRKRKAIAQDLGVHRTTVRHCLNPYHQRRVAGLEMQWAPGQPGRIPESLAPTRQKWVKEGPQSCGLARANWTYEDLAAHLYHTTGIAVKRTAMRVFCQRHDLRPYRPTYRYLRGDPEPQHVARQELEALKKRAPQGECVLLSQDEARFPLVPTLRAMLGVKGYRSTVGPWDNKDQVYCVAALNVVTGQLTTRLLEQPARSQVKMGQSQQQRLQVAFAAHLRDIARVYPASAYPEVVITIDHAPWHRGALMEQGLQEHPHLRRKRLPSYSPQLNVIERFWRVLRRRATPNRLFATMAALRTTLRNNLCYFQTMRHKMLALIESPRKAKKEAKLAAV
jgi:transposase